MGLQAMGSWAGAAGGIVGVLGALAGTYAAIGGTGGPRERASMARAAALGWLATSAALLGLWLLPVPYRFLAGLPCLVALNGGIRAVNRGQAAIRPHEPADGN